MPTHPVLPCIAKNQVYVLINRVSDTCDRCSTFTEHINNPFLLLVFLHTHLYWHVKLNFPTCMPTGLS